MYGAQMEIVALATGERNFINQKKKSLKILAKVAH